MVRVSFASKHVGTGPFRQALHGSQIAFGGPEDLPEPDWLVIFDEPPPGFVTRVPRARRIVILTEPPEIKPYRRRFLEQFGVAIAPMRISGYSGTVIRSHAALPWFYGTETLEELRQMPPPPKINAVSVVITRKTKTPLHRARLRFVEQLQRRLGDRLQVHGVGFHIVENKREAIDPVKYHLALENNIHENFWTEKIADAYLGWSLPLYSGCPNMADYVPADAFLRLELSDLAHSIDVVERCLDDDPYESRFAAITVARNRLLDEHNIFALMQRVVVALAPGAQGAPLVRPVPLLTNGAFKVGAILSRQARALTNPA
jgi:Glycosyltransferase family 10 (fucosyltransferase) C-term